MRRLAAKEQTESTERVTRPSADPTGDRILAAAADLFSDRSFEGDFYAAGMRFLWVALALACGRAWTTRSVCCAAWRSTEGCWPPGPHRVGPGFTSMERALQRIAAS